MQVQPVDTQRCDMRDREVHKPIGYGMRHVRLDHCIKTNSGHSLDVTDLYCFNCSRYAICIMRLDEDGRCVTLPPSTCPYGEV